MWRRRKGESLRAGAGQEARDPVVRECESQVVDVREHGFVSAGAARTGLL